MQQACNAFSEMLCKEQGGEIAGLVSGRAVPAVYVLCVSSAMLTVESPRCVLETVQELWPPPCAPSSDFTADKPQPAEVVKPQEQF